MDKLISVKWYDACSRNMDNQVKKLVDGLHSQIEGTELLATNITYGKLYKVLSKVLIILNEESDTDEDDFTFIPRGWIISPKKYKIKEKQL